MIITQNQFMKFKLLFLLSFITTSLAFPSRLPAGIVAEEVANGLGVVTDLTFLSKDEMLVSDRKGRILLVVNGTIQWNTIFADFKSRVGASFADRGLTSVEAHPDYPQAPFIYVTYQWDPEPLRDRTGPKMNRVSRFTVVKNGTMLDMDSEIILFGACLKNTTWYGQDCMPVIGESHVLGQAQFGPDKQLYVSVGEGYTFEGSLWWGRGYVDIPRDWLGPMDKNFPGGKVLRLHPETGKGLPDNPFYNGNADDVKSKVWTLGLRNPWRSTFVPSKLGDIGPTLLIGQVGWASFEAITIGKSGVNGGWPCYEGIAQTPPTILVQGKDKIQGADNVDNAKTKACQDFYAGKYPDVPPFVKETNGLTLDHSGKSSAIIMGGFLDGYGGNYTGKFVFGDYVTSKAWMMTWENGKVVGKPTLFSATLDEPTSFKVNRFDGYLYYTAMCKTCSKMGAVRRFVPGKNDGDVGGDVLVLGQEQAYNPPPPVISIKGKNATSPGWCVKGGNAGLPNGWDSIMYLGQFPGMRGKNLKDIVGPIEIDASLGGPGSEDGNQMTINGVRYQKGLGVGESLVEVDLKGFCSRMIGWVGVDDESIVGTARAVVEMGGNMVFDSNKSGGISKGKGALALDFDTTGKGLITFKVFGDAHVDWADVKFYCGSDGTRLPEIVIDYPTMEEGAKDVGTIVTFSARAWDYTGWQLNPMNGSTWTWSVNLQHCQGPLCHTHYLYTLDGVDRGRFVVETHDTGGGAQYYYYELVLEVVDQCGIRNKVGRNVLVNTSKTSVASVASIGDTNEVSTNELSTNEVSTNEVSVANAEVEGTAETDPTIGDESQDGAMETMDWSDWVGDEDARHELYQ